MRKDFFFDSCGAGRIHACRWEPNGSPRGIIQLVHGIAEYVERYDRFANFLTEHGFLVVAEDHMGHGKSISKVSPQGYFTGGWFSAVGDTYQLLLQTKGEYPNIPYILFGHSMGSFMARTILAKYPSSGIDGCIICGTGWQPDAVLSAGIGICNAVCKMSNDRKPSALLQKLIFGSYNKRVEHPRTAYDWINRVNGEVDAYVADPLCGFIPSAALVRDMLTGIAYIQKQENLLQMRKELPVLFIAGGDDPVGNYGDGVRLTAKKFTEVGMSSVAVRIYPLCRHEILNEIVKEDVYDDVLRWIEQTMTDE